MQRKILAYARQNAIALLALFVALGGSSYAALAINGSQIRNRSIDQVKLNPKSIAASIKAWAVVYVSANGASAGRASSPVQVQITGTGERVTWKHRRFSPGCLVSATPQITLPAGPYGNVTAQFDPSHGSLTLYGFGPDKLGRPQAADVLVVCP